MHTYIHLDFTSLTSLNVWWCRWQCFNVARVLTCLWGSNMWNFVRMSPPQSTTQLKTGVPQVSVLGPILFTSSIFPIQFVTSQFNVDQQRYADDTQVFISLSKSNSPDRVSRLETALVHLTSWFYHNGLALNPEKSEAILLGTHPRNKSLDNVTQVCSFPCLTILSYWAVLLTHPMLSTNMCLLTSKGLHDQAPVYLVRRCRCVRVSSDAGRARLMSASSGQLVVPQTSKKLFGDKAFASSGLISWNCLSSLVRDDCLSLHSFKKLLKTAQFVTCCFCRHSEYEIWHKLRSLWPASSCERIVWVVPNHCSAELHWLPVASRIHFKIATLTHNFLSTNTPSYLSSAEPLPAQIALFIFVHQIALFIQFKSPRTTTLKN